MALEIGGDENHHDVHVETFASDPEEANCFYKRDMTIQASGRRIRISTSRVSRYVGARSLASWSTTIRLL